MEHGISNTCRVRVRVRHMQVRAVCKRDKVVRANYPGQIGMAHHGLCAKPRVQPQKRGYDCV